MEDDAEGKNITGLVIPDLTFLILARVYNLGSNISRRSTSDVDKFFGILILSKSEVDNHRADVIFASTADQNVFQLNVSVHNVLLVQIPQPNE